MEKSPTPTLIPSRKKTSRTAYYRAGPRSRYREPFVSPIWKMSRVRLSDGNRCYEHTQNPRAKAYIEVSFFKREGSPDDDNLREIPLYVPPTRCATRVASCSPAAAAAVAYTTPATSASMQVAAGNFPNSRHPDVKGRPGSSFSLPRGATATGQFLGKQRSSSDPGSTRDMQTPISFGDFQSPDSPIELRCIEPRPQKRGGSLSIGADSMGALGFPMKSVVFGMAPLLPKGKILKLITWEN